MKWLPYSDGSSNRERTRDSLNLSMKREVDAFGLPSFNGGAGTGGKLLVVVAGVAVAEVTEKGLSTPRFIGIFWAHGADSIDGWG